MRSHNFTPITPELATLFYERCNGSRLVIEAAPLPFYAHGQLVRVSGGGPPLYFVAIGDTITGKWNKLTGSCAPIHDANEACGLNLTPDNVLAYLEFFCEFLDMDCGRMLLADTGSVWLDGGVFETVAPELIGYKDGRFVCTADGLYAGTMFKCEFKISADGNIRMTDDDPVEPITAH